MVQTYEYVTAHNGTVHLTPQDPTVRKTLCGRLVGNWMVAGDETQSGIAATCLRCKDVLKSAR